MIVRLSALVVWILVAAAAVFWGLKMFVVPAPLPAGAQPVGMAPPLAGDLTRLLGAAPVAAAPVAAPPPDAATRFRLTGVVATRVARDPQGPAAPGLALISVDGKPPQAYRVGDTLDGQFALVSVGLRSARVDLRGGGSGFVLELPPPAPAATGVPVAYSATSPVVTAPGMQPMQPMPGEMAGQDPNQGVTLPNPSMVQQGQMLPLGQPQVSGGMLGATPPTMVQDASGRVRAATQ